MIHNLKTLGTVLTAIFAMSVVSASAAQAEIFFRAEVENTTLTGEQTETQEFATNVGTFTCKVVTHSGLMAGITELEITLAPTYNECQLKNLVTFNATVHVNGCTYGFIASEGAKPKFTGYTNLECPAGKAIETTVKSEAKLICTVFVKPQAVEKIEYLEEGNGKTRDIRLNWNGSKIKYSEAGEQCPEEVGLTGTYAGRTTLKGKTTEQRGIWVE